MSSKSSLSRSDSVGNAAGDSNRRAVAYYNYHSLPVPSSGIDSLLKFVTSQLSLTILSLFFCCDLRTTPADVVDHVEKLTNCTILSISRNDGFDMEISKPLSLMGSHDPGKLILITDDGSFDALIRRLPGWQLIVFHSPDIDRNFFDYASRTIELPMMDEPESTFEKIEMKKWSSKPAADQPIKLNLPGMIMDLVEVNKSLRKMLEKLLVNNHKKTEQPTIMTISYEPKEETAFSKSEEPMSLDDNRQSFRGNGWDNYPQLDASLCGQMNGWDEVDRELEQEQQFSEPINPFGRKNPFGDAASSMPILPASPYNQDLYDNRALFRVANVCNGFVVQDALFDKPKSRDFAKMLPGQEIPPQLVSHGTWNKDATKKNPFFGRSQKPPMIPRNGKQQCPQWEDSAHRLDTTCTMYHPMKPCHFFPNCRQPAADCPFAHPFCTGGDCQCSPDDKDPRLNHYNPCGKE